MKMKKLLAGLMCLVMIFATVDMTAFASAEVLTVSGNDAPTVSDDDAGSVSGGDTVSDDNTGNDSDDTVSSGDTTVSGGDVDDTNKPGDEPTVSGGDATEPGDNPTVSGGDTSGDDNGNYGDAGEEDDDEGVTLPYTIDANGVLTSWSSAEGNITIPEGVTAIGNDVFLGNNNITSVTIPEEIVSIGDNAFKNCAKLESVRLPQSLTTIGANAFAGCSSMYMVYLKESDYAKINYIGERAFSGCENLSIFMSNGDFIIPDSVTSIGNGAFESCYKIKSVTLPKKLSVMGTGVFYDCQALTSVTLSANYNTIPEETFNGCFALNSITWSGITEIGERAFKNCEALTILTLPLSVANVRSQAFAGCTDLTFVVVDNNSISFHGAVFSDDHTTTLCGESGSEADYYQRGYSYLEFITQKDAAKVSYPINSSQIKRQLSGVLVYCYTVETTDGIQKQTEVDKALPGKEIYVQLQNIPSDYSLVNGSLKVNGEVLKEKEAGVYSFTQKPGGANLTAEFAQIKFSDNLGVVSYETSESIENGLKVGQTVQLYMFSNKVTLEKPLNGSRFSFKNYDKSKLGVTVDSQGHVSLTGKAAGKVTLEIWNKFSDTKIKEIEIEVKSVAISNMDLHITDSSAHIEEETQDEDGTRNLKVIERYVGDGISFTVKANGWDAEGTPLNVAYQWSSSDTTIAKPSKTTTTVGNNTNKITIPKGAGGEATVTVTAKDGSGLSKRIHIKVVNGKPSFKLETSTFNFYKEKPMVVSLIESYGYAVQEDSLKLYDLDEEDKVVSASKIFSVVPDTSEAGKYIIVSKTGEKVTDGEYWVALDGETDAGHFSHKFTITVKNSIPSAKVKQTGKINLFYTADAVSQGVTLNVSGYGNEKIAAYELSNLNAGDDEQLQADYNKFSYNFDIDRSTGVISRKADTMGVYETGNNKGKAVVTGNLLIYFEGYTEPRTIKINVATENKKPSFVLEKSSGTYNINRANPVSEFTLPVYEKQGKKLTQVLLSEGGWQANINFAKSTGFFMANDTDVTIKNDVIAVSTGQINEKGKLVINLFNPELWGSENYIELAYTVKVSNKQPKVSLVTSKVSINPEYQNQVAEFSLKSNQPDCVVSDTQLFEPLYSSKSIYNENIEKISVVYEDGIGTVTIPGDVRVKDGTYKFTCYTQVMDDYYVKGVGTNVLNKVTLSVAVKNSVPSIKLKSSKFTMNLSAKGKETIGYSVTVKNAPVAESGYELSEISVVSGYTDYVDFVYEDGFVKATLNENESFGTGNFKYELVPVWSNGVHEVEGSKLKVTLAVQNKPVSVTVGSAKGKLDLLNREETGISYKVTVKNINDTIINPSIYELDKWGKPENEESTHFYAQIQNGNLVVKAYDNADITSGKSYSFKVKYSLATDPDNVRTMNKVLKVKPVQTFPKLTQSTKNISLYQSNKGYYAYVTVTADKKSTATITGIEWANGVDDKMKESFGYEITSINEENNSVTIAIWLNKNYRFAVGKTQTLKFAVRCEGQDENTFGTAFSVKAAVNR